MHHKLFSFAILFVAPTLLLVLVGSSVQTMATERSPDNQVSSVQNADITARVSVASDGSQGNGDSKRPSISADGRYVAFFSNATNLVSGDTNGAADVFAHDRVTHQTTRVSVASDGTQGNAGSYSYRWSVSADGRFVAFYSDAGNLVSGDTNGTTDVFVHDRVTHQTTRVSVASDGTQGNSSSYFPSLSADGRFVAFYSNASNLVNGDTNGVADVFVHDRVTHQTSRVSVASDGTQGNGESIVPVISPDGRYVAFQSSASNLVSGDSNSSSDIFVHDRVTGETTRVSLTSDGTQGNGDSYQASISADGRYVAFCSSANNLVSSDTNYSRDIFVHDRVTGETTRISVASNGAQANNDSLYPSMSADGALVAFYSLAYNLVMGDANNNDDVFVHDRVTGQTTLVSVASDGTQGDTWSLDPSISADGCCVAFDSYASNLVGGDTNDLVDVFVHGSGGGVTTYAVSGRVTENDGDSIPDVTVSAGPGGTATTNAHGVYTLTVSAGTYTLTPSKSNYSFSPTQRTVDASQDVGSQDFVGLEDGGPPTPFLDLPFAYGGTRSAFVEALQNWNQPGGRVNSWFDHRYPDYGYNNGTGIWLYNSKHTMRPYWVDERKTVLCYDTYCYDGHNGLDFSYQDPQPEVEGKQDLPILAASAGKVVATNTGCPSVGNPGCGGGYGNYVILYHSIDSGHGYFTRYAHLSSVSVVSGTDVISGDSLGIMGNSGRSSGVHLHFGVYRDNGNEKWDGDSVDKPVDPFEYGLSDPDPWVVDRQGPISHRLWVYDPVDAASFPGSQGTQLKDATNTMQVTVAPDTFSGQVTLELSPGPVAGPSAELRSAGRSFRLRVLEWLPEDSALRDVTQMQNAAGLTLTQPITFAVAYSDTGVLHLDVAQLALHRWDEALEAWQLLSGTVDAVNHVVTATSQELGSFYLLAPLLCPADASEPDDDFYAARVILTDSMPVGRLFDIVEDEDWFRLETAAGKKYVVQTGNLATGVDTVVEIYDVDGMTLLASDDNSGEGLASYLEWSAPMDGTYFIRVAQSADSAYGCDASYELGVTELRQIYLPLILRN